MITGTPLASSCLIWSWHGGKQTGLQIRKQRAECSSIILCQSHHLRPGRQSVTVGKAQGHEGHRIPPPHLLPEP